MAATRVFCGETGGSRRSVASKASYIRIRGPQPLALHIARPSSAHLTVLVKRRRHRLPLPSSISHAREMVAPLPQPSSRRNSRALSTSPAASSTSATVLPPLYERVAVLFPGTSASSAFRPLIPTCIHARDGASAATELRACVIQPASRGGLA